MEHGVSWLEIRKKRQDGPDTVFLGFLGLHRVLGTGIRPLESKAEMQVCPGNELHNPMHPCYYYTARGVAGLLWEL